MINIYESDAPLILRHMVNGKEGFVILPKGEDDDGIYFEDLDTLRAWIALLDLNRLTHLGDDPTRVEWFDDWIERDGSVALGETP